MANKAGSGGLAVGAGDTDGAALEERCGEFDFTNYRHAAPSRLLERLEIGRDIGREHDELGRLENRGGLLGEWDVEFADAGQFVERLEVGGAHHSALPDEQRCGSQTRLLHADHQRLFVLEVHRSFSVVSANSASTRPAIQKRAMIFDSVQPSASK